jgi:PPOX class probable F420-dependent enzyme
VIVTVTFSENVRRLLDAPNPAVLATINADGSPQTSVVWVGREGDELVISSAQGRRKDRNIGRDPRVSLSVYDQADPETYVEIRGRATVTGDIGRALAVRLAEFYEGPGAGETYLALPPEVVRVVIRVFPEHVAGKGLLRSSATRIRLDEGGRSVSVEFEVGQAVSVSDRGRTYAGEIVKAGRFQVNIKYLGRVVMFSRVTQVALGTESGSVISFTTPADVAGQDRIRAARQVLARHGVELSPRHTFTAGQVEALAEVVKTWHE